MRGLRWLRFLVEQKLENIGPVGRERVLREIPWGGGCTARGSPRVEEHLSESEVSRKAEDADSGRAVRKGERGRCAFGEGVLEELQIRGFHGESEQRLAPFWQAHPGFEKARSDAEGAAGQRRVEEPAGPVGLRIMR